VPLSFEGDVRQFDEHVGLHSGLSLVRCRWRRAVPGVPGRVGVVGGVAAELDDLLGRSGFGEDLVDGGHKR
jgi:hypothetical protein